MNTEQAPYTSIQYMRKSFSPEMEPHVQQTIHNVAKALMPLAAAMDEWPSGYVEINENGTFTIHSFPPSLRDKILELLKQATGIGHIRECGPDAKTTFMPCSDNFSLAICSGQAPLSKGFCLAGFGAIQAHLNIKCLLTNNNLY